MSSHFIRNFYFKWVRWPTLSRVVAMPLCTSLRQPSDILQIDDSDRLWERTCLLLAAPWRFNKSKWNYNHCKTSNKIPSKSPSETKFEKKTGRPPGGLIRVWRLYCKKKRKWADLSKGYNLNTWNFRLKRSSARRGKGWAVVPHSVPSTIEPLTPANFVQLLDFGQIVYRTICQCPFYSNNIRRWNCSFSESIVVSL